MQLNMKIVIDTYKKVVESFTYLEEELKMTGLDKAQAILYFQILLGEEENGVLERPHFTFVLEDFSKYISFFKSYNFLDRGFNRNSYRLTKNWKDDRVLHTISSSLEDEFLQASIKHEELNNYLRISA
jgi:hypothetical protein